MKFYDALRKAYPDIQVISNCDASSTPLNHPADFYDFHVNIVNILYVFDVRLGFL